MNDVGSSPKPTALDIIGLFRLVIRFPQYRVVDTLWAARVSDSGCCCTARQSSPRDTFMSLSYHHHPGLSDSRRGAREAPRCQGDQGEAPLPTALKHPFLLPHSK